MPHGVMNMSASWSGGGSGNGAGPQLKGAKSFSLSELKKGMNNFSDNTEIGGGYSKVPSHFRALNFKIMVCNLLREVLCSRGYFPPCK